MPFEDIKGPLSNWVTTESIQKEIKRRFKAFLKQYKDELDEYVYKKRVRDMCVGKRILSHSCSFLKNALSCNATKALLYNCQLTTVK